MADERNVTEPAGALPADDPRGDRQTLSVRFWGVRGSIPAPGPDTLRYGGETTAIEIRCGDRVVMIDCGSGVRLAGRELSRSVPGRMDVLFTHTHLDHICGLPFFCVAYDPNIAVNLWAGHIPPDGTLEEIVQRLMSPPIFPVATSALNNTHFRSFTVGSIIDLGDGLTVRTVRLNHPGNATGYRFDWCGSSLAIITDHEHGKPEIDDPIADFVKDATVMVYDAMYRDEEYPRFKGWGHSTPGQALALAKRANVGHTVLFHHDPTRTDDQIDTMAAELVDAGEKASFARQGDTLLLRNGQLSRAERDAKIHA
ncbi:MBL fold metallo-hydrolase [Acuticoccus sp. MNP-M23]|uniref:MBL fold metallo-hydrolase n=1 Tax=Acuticoccus sp. MNP-M23 TaxID=3072793 RepID=UPI0028167A8D|nr:MBL fold metallo-hydrolase [Acuticoccus sp. MNP-M23]WMS41002.1 MBL fold metallo-hydrolase [Acuticoccus sp. MNP-M23]